MEVYRHKKTGNVYKVIFKGALLATNGNVDENKPHVIYQNKEGKLFVRAAYEFEDKFLEINCRNCINYVGWCGNCKDCSDGGKFKAIPSLVE